MAMLGVPRAHLTKDEHRRYEPAEDRIYRLPQNHAQDLRDVARGVEESDAGVCCSYLVDSMSGEGADFDEHALSAVERFAEQAMSFDFVTEMLGVPVVSRWRERVRRCRRALRLLHEGGDSRSVSVLMVAHGYPDPIAAAAPELLAMGPLGSLARYVDATEGRRQELVRREAAALRRGWGLRHAVPEDAGGDGRWQNLHDFLAEKDSRRMADAVVTSADALRDAFAPFSEPAPRPRFLRGEERELHVEVRPEPPPAFEARKEARRAREAAHRARRDAFAVAVRVDALKMISAAERAYHAAWLRSASSGEGGRARAGRDLERAEIYRGAEPAPVASARARGAGWSVA